MHCWHQVSLGEWWCCACDTSVEPDTDGYPPLRDKCPTPR